MISRARLASADLRLPIGRGHLPASFAGVVLGFPLGIRIPRLLCPSPRKDGVNVTFQRLANREVNEICEYYDGKLRGLRDREDAADIEREAFTPGYRPWSRAEVMTA